MKINYLFSGLDKENGFNDMQSECLIKNIKDNSVITYIASDFDDIVKSKKYSSAMMRFFETIGIKFKKVNLVDSSVSINDAKEMLNSSNIVFLMGGSPYLQMKGINKYGLKDKIKTIDLVIGVSAGSMNQSKRVVYEDEDFDMKLYDYEGLGLVDFNIYPHLDFNNIELLKESFRISEIIPIICLPDDSFIRVIDSKIEELKEMTQM